jgi:hypothetical protein
MRFKLEASGQKGCDAHEDQNRKLVCHARPFRFAGGQNRMGRWNRSAAGGTTLTTIERESRLRVSERSLAGNPAGVDS